MNASPIPGSKPDYGIDAPGIRRAMLAAGLGALTVVALASILAARTTGDARAAAKGVGGLAIAASLYGLGMGGYMTWGSRVGKLRDRDRLLALVEQARPWSGGETVLDVGCGRGLMMIGAAKRLSTGRAIGIDLWQAEDQSANTPEAARENAWREGVAERVEVRTGDARALPFSACAFDLVLSHWVVHNLPVAADQLQALNEMVRVLRPGGVLVLADIAHRRVYREHLQAAGIAIVCEPPAGAVARMVGVLSGGSFRPWAMIGKRTTQQGELPRRLPEG